MANVVDSFNRGTNTSSLGTADSGQTWSNFGGGWLGINGTNQAQVYGSTGGAGAVIDSGSGEVTVEVTLSSTPATQGIVFRWQDASNYMNIQLSGNRIYIQKVVSGSATNLANSAVLSWAAGDIISIVASGTSLTAKKNGTTVASATDGAFMTATKHGLLAQPMSAVYDVFSVTNAAGGGTATKVAVVQQPSGGSAGNTFGTPAAVQLQDASSVVDTSATHTITATLNVISGSGTLSGTTVKAAVNGAATFSDLKVSAAGTYTITFSATGLTSATTAQFTVTARPNSPYLNAGTDGKDLGADISILNTLVATAISGDRRSVTETRYGGANQWFSFGGVNRAQYPRTLLDTETMPNRAGMTVHNINSDAGLATLLGGATLTTGAHIVVLDNTVVYSGNYYRQFPVRNGDAAPGGNNIVVFISKAIYDSMPAGTWDATVCPAKKRVTSADLANLAHFRCTNTLGAFMVSGPTKGWRFIGLRFSVDSSITTSVGHLACFGDGDGTLQPNVSQCPSNCGFDRCWFDGNSTVTVRHGVELHCQYGYLIDSGFGDNIRVDRAYFAEGHAVYGFNGPGPFRIVNNRIVGASMFVFFGGAPSACGIVADVEFRWNYMTRPRAWQGTQWTVKCGFELKKAQFVLAEGNINEENWPDGQDGAAWLLKSESYGDGATIGYTADCIFRYNRTRKTNYGFTIAGVTNTDPAYPPKRMVLYGNETEVDGYGNTFLAIGLSEDPCIINNTFIANGEVNQAMSMTYPNAANPPSKGLTVLNNIFEQTNYGWKVDGGSLADLANNIAGGTGSFLNNAVVGAPVPPYPATTFGPANRAAIAFEDDVNKVWYLHGTTQGSPQVATALAMDTEPSNGTTGVAQPTQPVVKVVDSVGATVGSDTSTVTAQLITVSGTGTAIGTLTKAAVAGVAVFTGLGVTSAGGGTFKWRFTDGSLTSVDSAVFTVVGTASKLVIQTPPAGIITGLNFAQQPVVAVTDASGNVVTSATDSITVTRTSGTATLAGTTPKAAVSGVATWTDLKLTGSGTVVLTFSSGTLTSALTGTLTVSPAQNGNRKNLPKNLPSKFAADAGQTLDVLWYLP